MKKTEQFQDEFLATYRRTSPKVTRTEGAFRSAMDLFCRCCYGDMQITAFVYSVITRKVLGPELAGQRYGRFKMAFFVFSLDHNDPLDHEYYWTDLIKVVLKENSRELHSRYLNLEQEYEARRIGTDDQRQ